MSEPMEEIAPEIACSGSCFGTGMGYKIVHSACPDPCNKDHKTRVRDIAKTKAYANSQKWCKGEHCECYGSHSAIIPEQCVSIKNSVGRDICLYFAAYAYMGECSTLV